MVTFSGLGANRYGCQSCSWPDEEGGYISSPFIFAPENLISRNMLGRPIPRQLAHFPRPEKTLCVFTAYSPPSRYLRRRQSLLSAAIASITTYRVTLLHTDGVYRKASVGVGPVVLTIVRVTSAHIQETRWTNFCAHIFSYTH